MADVRGCFYLHAGDLFSDKNLAGEVLCRQFCYTGVLWLFLSLFGQKSEGTQVQLLKEGWKIVESGKSIAGYREEVSKEPDGQRGLWILLALLNLAGGASSSLAILLSCLMTAGFGFLFALKEKKFSVLVKAGLTCIPGGVYVVLYAAVTHGLLAL